MRAPQAAVLAAALLVLTGCSHSRSSGATPSDGASSAAEPSPPPADAEATARAFLDAWSGKRYDDLAALTDDRQTAVGDVYRRLADRLRIDGVTVAAGQWDATSLT